MVVGHVNSGGRQVPRSLTASRRQVSPWPFCRCCRSIRNPALPRGAPGLRRDRRPARRRGRQGSLSWPFASVPAFCRSTSLTALPSALRLRLEESLSPLDHARGDPECVEGSKGLPQMSFLLLRHSGTQELRHVFITAICNGLSLACGICAICVICGSPSCCFAVRSAFRVSRSALPLSPVPLNRLTFWRFS